MPKDSKLYYDNFNWKSANLHSKLDSKIEIIKNTIPKDVGCILDVGCGDGTISNALSKNYDVLAIDRSKNALKYLIPNSICASARFLPIKDEKFDLVFSSEMIEHLPDEIFFNSLNELKRVTKKYIYLTFPDNENIEKSLVECPKCKFRFNKVYHLRTLNLKKIRHLFPEYELVLQIKWGKKIRQYNKTLSKIKHRFVSPESWIPNYWTQNNNRNTLCPNCNLSFEIPYRFSLWGFLIDALNVVISSKKNINASFY